MTRDRTSDTSRACDAIIKSIRASRKRNACIERMRDANDWTGARTAMASLGIDQDARGVPGRSDIEQPPEALGHMSFLSGLFDAFV
jgi:hypothetical protein